MGAQPLSAGFWHPALSSVLLVAALGHFGNAALAQEVVALPGCRDLAAWNRMAGERPQSVAANTLLSEMSQRDVVLLGEHHDDEDHHLWQLHTLAALYGLRPHMVIGFEMFPRRVQPALERWVAGELSVKQLLEQTDWDNTWKVPAELYLPLLQFARINRIPLIALNVDQKLNTAIAASGLAAVPLADREGVGTPAPASDAYLKMLLQVHRQHSGLGGKDSANALSSDLSFRNFVDSQTTWDRAMAEALAAARKADAQGQQPLVLGIMGSGHIGFGYGVPHQLQDLGISRVGTLVPLNPDTHCEQFRVGLADAIFALPRQPQTIVAPPPRLGVRLEEHASGVRIAQVTPDSLAERTGLSAGDVLLEVAGVPAQRIGAVIAAIRRQPAGTWLPVRLQRGEQTLELVIKFSPAS